MAERLEHYRQARPVVLGLPRGGVPVAYEVAVALEAPLDVLVSRKIGAPMQPELAIAAIAPERILYLDRRAVRYMDIDEETLQRLIQEEAQEVQRRNRRYRGSDGIPDVRGRTVILVDDGIATGLTVLAAVKAVREAEPERVVLAVPVSSQQATELLENLVDDFVCLAVPEDLMAVGLWYVHFDPTSDEEVVELLTRANARVPSPPDRHGS